jgi:hypothetical protein
MNKSILICCLLITSLASAAEKPQLHKNEFAGIYALNRGNESGCMLAIDQAPDNKSSFGLECNRGAPSYNSGVLEGGITIKNGKAVYRTTEFAGVCEIKFTFTKNSVSLAQKGSDSDCGFGHGVYCDGTYILQKQLRKKLDQ